MIQYRFPAGFIHEQPGESGSALAVIDYLMSEFGQDLEAKMLGRGVQLSAWAEPGATVFNLAGEPDSLRQALGEFIHTLTEGAWRIKPGPYAGSVSNASPLQRLIRLAYGSHPYGNAVARPATQPTASTLNAFARRTYRREGMQVIVITGPKQERLIKFVNRTVTSFPTGWQAITPPALPSMKTSVTIETHSDAASDILIAFPIRLNTIEASAAADIATRTLIDGPYDGSVS